ncbi:MAG TPA: hypothetical protein PLL26_04595 [Candidatus Dojkabacteria bacterium]|nr:hypothetical protein [Candidatus Dojkabacteria bacterium]
MDKYILFITSLFLIISVIIIVGIIITRMLKQRESEFVVNYNVLLNIIELYKESILINEINTLRLQYDLNDKSPTNSRMAFEKAKNELISKTVKKIIKEYLSKDCLKALLRHYSIDGLSLLIITHFKR